MDMENIDKLTMELFMNKKSYNRYIEQNDPKKYSERLCYIEKMKKFKNRILSMTEKYLENPDLQITNEMNQMFMDYCKTCVKYFEIETDNTQENEDDDTLFDPKYMENS
jgi:hypothetical protein